MLEPRVINNDAMEGRLRPRLLAAVTGLLFEGDVSLASGGGLASFRAPLHVVDVQTIGRLIVVSKMTRPTAAEPGRPPVV